VAPAKIPLAEHHQIIHASADDLDITAVINLDDLHQDAKAAEVVAANSTEDSGCL